MDTRETPAINAAEATAPEIESGDICALAIQKTVPTQKEMVKEQTGLCCLATSHPASFLQKILLCCK